MVARFATLISPFSSETPFLTTWTYKSCEIVEAPDNVNPATTAKIVANATEAINPRKALPPVFSARSRAAIFPPLSKLKMASFPTKAKAANPIKKVKT